MVTRISCELHKLLSEALRKLLMAMIDELIVDD